MTIFTKFKHIIKISDFFYSSDMLRYQNQQQYRTLTGGLLSLGIIITIIIGFASMIIDTLNLTTITTQKQVKHSSDPIKSTLIISKDSMFMFGIEVWGIDLTKETRYFDINFQLYQYQGGKVINITQLPLEKCTVQHWGNFPEILKNYDSLQISHWLCPLINTNLTLQGKYSSDFYSQYYITASACSNESSSNRPCAPQQQIDLLFQQNQSFFYFTFYFTNPVINSDQKDYKNYYLSDSSYIIFGDKIGSQSVVQFTDYTIETDESIWPFEQVAKDQGCIVQSMGVDHPFQVNNNSIFAFFKLVKSSQSVTYNRSVQKLSSVLSYMGGMIGAISALLFILKWYTSLSYEISIAIDIIKPDKGSNVKQEEVQMNFFTFLRYWLYKIVKYFRVDCEWPTIDYIQECQKQILKQLDVKSLLKRVIFIQYCLTFLFEDYQLNGLQLKMPKSARQIRKIRQKCQSVYSGETETINDSESTIKDQLTDFIILETPQHIKHPTLISLGHNKVQIKNKNKQQSKTWKIKRRGFIQNSDDAPKIQIIPTQQLKIQQFNDPLEHCQIYKIKKTQTNKKLRDSYLQTLCAHAESGNPISKKIWRTISHQLPNDYQLNSNNNY